MATFSVTSSDKPEYDDLSDLTPMEMESVREWEAQFKEKYILVGRLLKPGEQPTNYSDEDEDTPNESTTPTGDSAGKSATKDETTAAAAAPSSPKKTADSSSPSSESKPADSTSTTSAPTTTTTAEATSKAEDLKSGGDSKAATE